MSCNKTINSKQSGGIVLKNKRLRNKIKQISTKRKNYQRKQEPLKLYKVEVTTWT